MPLDPSAIKEIPLFADMGDAQQIEQLCSMFKQESLAEGDVLFQAGDQAMFFCLLTKGEICLYKGKDIRFRLHPPAPIGELGALTDLDRNTTAMASKPSEVWRVPKADLLEFFSQNVAVAFSYYKSMLQIVANKVRRDQLRLEDMRSNLIRTQKSMKKMRDFILESPDSPISDEVHTSLEKLIKQNRRVNYRVEPPPALPADIRHDSGKRSQIIEMSRTNLLLDWSKDSQPSVGSAVSCVLCLPGTEFPISGLIVDGEEGCVELQLDALIDDYSEKLDDYLTNVQLLDFVV